MFLDEPEGNSFRDLQQYLGFCCALGTAISVKLADGKQINANIYWEQTRLPDEVALFKKNEKWEEEVFYIQSKQIMWFKLGRSGIGRADVDENGDPKLLILIMGKEIKGNGKIINSGTTAIFADNMDFEGIITDKETDK
jgi:hypothetical protein